MAALRRLWEKILSLGAYPSETDGQRGKRRIVAGALVFGVAIGIIGTLDAVDRRLTGVAVLDLALASTFAGALVALHRIPGRFNWIVNVVFASLLINLLAETVLLGGLQESEVSMMFGLLAVLGALIALSMRAAFWWFGAFVLSLVLGAVLPNWIEPAYTVEHSPGELALTMIGVTTLVFVTLAYFVRQRNRLQTESDELLHNILPSQIASRLKSGEPLIADSYESVSVLFADVVDFTPLSADMQPAELVGLLNRIFTTFDSFVSDLGLEKIKTVGDEYMAAAGVPVARQDHAHAVADLALQIRDYVESSQFEGHQISLRIGINSGQVVAGVVGTHKFAYDLWGDVVNIASRMESEGIPGAIQITPATYELLQADFVCEPRGPITVKGKGEMEAYLLRSRR